jgi:hypothetical protein
MSVDLETPQRFGATPHGTRVIVYAKGGRVDGPNIKGKVLPGGGDWLIIRPDSASELDVRGTIQTVDGRSPLGFHPNVLLAGYPLTSARYDRNAHIK